MEHVKEYLTQASGVERRIEAKLYKIEYYRGLAERVTNIFSTEKVSGGVSLRSRIEDCVCKIIELEDAVAGDIYELVKLKAEAEQLIREVRQAEHQQLLELRYICCKSLEEVADTMGYSYRQVTRLHKAALENIALEFE